MSDVWAELNERQRTYLGTLYECDQATEEGRRQRAARGHWDRTPASKWRWQMYGPADSALYERLRAAGLVDPGTGSTWKALEDRKLVQCRYVPDAFGVQLVEDIPGIGENREALLHKFGIRTALQYAQAPHALIQRLLGRMGTDLWHELQGIPLYPLELEPKPPKSIARTASLGMVTSDPDVLKAHLVHHVTRLTTELVSKELLTGRVWVFLRRKSFETSAAEARLHRLTASYQALCQITMEAYDRLYQEGELYRGCGIIAGDIFPAEGQTPDLFEGARKEERQTRLVQTMDAINRRYGRGTLCRLATLPLGEKRPGGRFHYPLLKME